LPHNVSAGWHYEATDDIRPGQWLGLLKCIGLMGVDFFHTTYFSLGIPWHDPKGWVWQASTPSYAQAILTHAESFLTNGHILRGDIPLKLGDPGGPMGFMFNTGNANELVVVRKNNTNDSYLISGTIQKVSNISDNAPFNRDVTFTLDGQLLKCNIRRQGSTYIFDNTNPSAPVFYQLDKWHQYEHPERWTQDFDFEAEVFDNTSTAAIIETEDPTLSPHSPITTGDFSNFTSYVTFSSGISTLEYNFQPRTDAVSNDYDLWIRARSKSGGLTGLNVTLQNADPHSASPYFHQNKIGCILTSDWEWYQLEACSSNAIAYSSLVDGENYVLRLLPLNNDIEIDRIYLNSNDGTPLPFTPSGPFACTYNPSLNNTSVTTSSLGSSLANSTVEITGTFTIDADFTFDHCNITMGAGAEIIVGPSVTFNINASNISSCSDMWQGITINNAVPSQVIITNSTIEDALYGFFANNGTAQINISDSYFDHNYKSGYFGSGLYSASTITNTNFDCSGGLVLKSPHTGEKTLMQIELNNAYTIIGDGTLSPNRFSGAEYGIYATDSYLECYNNIFHDFVFNPVLSDNAAIYAKACVMIKIGDATNTALKNTFQNCDYANAIFVSSNIEIYNNDYIDCEIGVFTFFNLGSNISINDNNMNNVYQGISSVWNGNNSVIDIKNNNIRVIDDIATSNVGISLGENNFLGYSQYTVKQNTIHSHGEWGIYINTLKNSILEENHIYLDHPNPTGEVWGIMSNYSNSTTFSCNQVDDNTTSHGYKRAFTFFDSDQITVGCNYSYNNEAGLQFIGNCASSEIKGNEIHDAEDAFVMGDMVSSVPTSLDNFMQLPSGDLTGNKWYNNNNETHTFYQSTVPNLWTKNGSGSADYPDDNVATSGSALSPAVQPTLNLYSCPSCAIPAFVDDDDSHEFNFSLALQIAQNLLPAMTEDDITAWKAKKKLYEELRNDNTLLDSSTILEAFYDSLSNENIGRLTDVDELMAITGDSTIMQDSTLLAIAVGDAATANSNIVSDVLPEFNQKVVNDIYLSSIAKKRYALSTNELEDAMMVASQCIYAGGPAVLTARDLVHSQNPFVLFNDAENCIGSSYRKAADDQKENTKTSFSYVFPNPAKDEATIAFNKLESNGTLIISDMSGKQVLQIVVPQNNYCVKIDLNTYAKGSYIYSIIVKNEKQISGRFEVIK
jgi:hypothetical protein